MLDQHVVRNAVEYERNVEGYASFNADRGPITGYLDALCDRVSAGDTVLDLAGLAGKRSRSTSAGIRRSASICRAPC